MSLLAMPVHPASINRLWGTNLKDVNQVVQNGTTARCFVQVQTKLPTLTVVMAYTEMTYSAAFLIPGSATMVAGWYYDSPASVWVRGASPWEVDVQLRALDGVTVLDTLRLDAYDPDGA